LHGRPPAVHGPGRPSGACPDGQVPSTTYLLLASSIRLNGVSVARRNLVKPPLREYLREPHFAGLGAEPETNFLRQGVRRADHGGRRVVQAPDRRRVLGEIVACEWLRQEHGAVILQRLSRVAGGPDGIAHVVQAIEEANQIKSRSVYVCAAAVMKLTRPPTPASAARLPAISTEGLWKSIPTNRELG